MVLVVAVLGSNTSSALVQHSVSLGFVSRKLEKYFQQLKAQFCIYSFSERFSAFLNRRRNLIVQNLLCNGGSNWKWGHTEQLTEKHWTITARKSEFLTWSLPLSICGERVGKVQFWSLKRWTYVSRKATFLSPGNVAAWVRLFKH